MLTFLAYAFLLGPLVIVLTPRAVAYWKARRRRQREQRDTLTANYDRTSSYTVPIICVNCGDLDGYPVRTLLTRDGNCNSCGKAHFQLASDLARVQPLR